MLSLRASPLSLHRWVERLPKQYCACLSGKVKKKAGPGRCCLEVWPNLCIATVIKHTKKKRVGEVSRKITRGTVEKAQALLTLTKGCQQFNTAFIERFNGTMAETSGFFHTKMSPCCGSSGNAGKREVGDWLQL